MAKANKFYFSHDHNARNDIKIASLVREYKAAGYGIYWATAEMMHEEGGDIDYDELTIAAVAKDLNETVEFVEEVIGKCITRFKLFVLNEASLQKNEASLQAIKKLTSGRVIRNLTAQDEKSKKNSENGRKGGISSGFSRRNENNEKKNEPTNEANEAWLQANEAKEKKRKENTTTIIQEDINLSNIEETNTNRENFVCFTLYNKTVHEVKEMYKQPLSKNGFEKWKEFIDFIKLKKYTDLFKCRFLLPHEFEEIWCEKKFTEDIWEITLSKLLSTGIKPEHNLFFRIPEFIKYGNNGQSNGKYKEHTGSIVTNFAEGQRKRL